MSNEIGAETLFMLDLHVIENTAIRVDSNKEIFLGSERIKILTGMTIQAYILQTGNYTPEKAANPPSIGIVIPVTKELSSLANQIAAPINSSGFPNRPIGV